MEQDITMQQEVYMTTLMNMILIMSMATQLANNTHSIIMDSLMSMNISTRLTT